MKQRLAPTAPCGLWVLPDFPSNNVHHGEISRDQTGSCFILDTYGKFHADREPQILYQRRAWSLLRTVVRKQDLNLKWMKPKDD
jgi:hypothetical protein